MVKHRKKKGGKKHGHEAVSSALSFYAIWRNEVEEQKGK
jgi:hypothetical protein